jgi:hypothetical protein
MMMNDKTPNTNRCSDDIVLFCLLDIFVRYDYWWTAKKSKRREDPNR